MLPRRNNSLYNLPERPPLSVREIYNNTKKALKDGGIEDYEFEAVQLLESIELEHKTLITDPGRLVERKAYAELEARVQERLEGKPLQYVVGEWDFYGFKFRIGEGVLIPRPETEILAEIALKHLQNRPDNKKRTLDMCAGTGCIGIVLYKLANADLAFNEPCYEANKYLLRNMKQHKLPLKDVFLFDILKEEFPLSGFDLIVCNPPYLSGKDMKALPKTLMYEPASALYGGEDGLDFYRVIIPEFARKLYKTGMLAMEIGKGQASAVCKLFRQNDLEPKTQNDLSGITRVVYAVKE